MWGSVGTLLGVMCLWTWFPLVDLAFMSFNREPFRGIPNGNTTLEWYRGLFSRPQVKPAVVSSIEIALIVAGIVAVVSLLVARQFHRIQQKGLFLLFVLLPVFVPGLILGFALLISFAEAGLALGRNAIIVAHVLWAFPFAFLSMLVATSRLDRRLLAAAQDLGASKWRVFCDIELPLVKGGVISAFLFGFLLSFNELLRSIYVSSSEVTLPLYAWSQNSSRASTAPIVYSLSTIIMVVSLVCIGGAYAVLGRTWRRSRTEERDS